MITLICFFQLKKEIVVEFLNNVEVGDPIWIKSISETGKTVYFEDVILRKLKTKIETKTGDFNTKDGSILDSDDMKYIIEYTDKVEKHILNQKYSEILTNMMDMVFDDNKIFSDYIQKVENIYKANINKCVN